MDLKLGTQRIVAHRRAAGGWVVFPLAIFLVAGLVLSGYSFAPIALLGAPIVPLLTAAIVHRRPIRLSGELRMNASELDLDGIRLVPRSQMTDAFVERRADGRWRVEITTSGRWRRLVFSVKDRRRAQAVLSTMHLGPNYSIRAYQLSWHRLRSPSLAVAVAILPLLVGIALPVLLGAPAFGCVVSVVALYAATAGALRLLAPVISIGPDGLLWSIWRRSRFIPFGEIQSMTRWRHRDRARSEGLDITLASGEIVPLRTANVNESGQLLRRDPVYARFRTLMRRQRDVSGIAARLSPKQRQSVSRWVLRLRRLGAGADVGPRVAEVSSDELVRLLESPAVTPIDRAAAAVALGSSDRAPEVRARIEQLSASVLSPTLRGVLEAVAEHPDDDDRLAEALTPLCR